MAFQFSLQIVLHLRENLEHQQELRLRAANHRVAHMQSEFERVEAQRQQLRDQQTSDLSIGMTAAELRFELERESELLIYKRKLERELAELRQLRDEQLEIFQQARRVRETLDAVRDRQQRHYQRETQRRQQRKLDDLFLMSKLYLRRG